MPFASFLSGGFITAIEVNSSERKLVNAPLCTTQPMDLATGICVIWGPPVTA